MTRVTRPPTSRQRRAANRARHHEERMAGTGNGPKGIATAWAEAVRRTARLRAEAGDPGVWVHLAQTLEWYCSRHPPADTARSARRAFHWEERRAGLADADPRTLASAWWDRARSVASEQTGETGWNDLALTLKNMADHYSE
ncbi:hypothetical protein R6L23_35965 [Streptomyces sp. SR27]|uniref:hypothetical protein n=1 Tax=Streptomyces sp. SR27 TaxID=3076630 RepID=UPI00295A94F5|nr:hypothetical protein [Streptomyces sp. SR27]MDV9193547.1 hypothetical protein [Streptomyces sp. SR27]